MNFRSFLLWVAATALCPHLSFAADQLATGFRKAGPQGEIVIHSDLNLPVSGVTAQYTILQSSNLIDWVPSGYTTMGQPGVSDDLLRVQLPATNKHLFYRVVADRVMAQSDAELGSAIYGYGTAFSKQLQALGQLPLPEFSQAFAPPAYLPQLSFDPTIAEYWSNYNAGGTYALNEAEKSRFLTNGFVVSQRLGAYSFARSFYDIFTRDLPVYVSADAVLHAWHRSYVSMLEELEETTMANQLDSFLQGMAAQLPALYSQAAGTPIQDGLRDADHFIAVARSLSTGTNNYGSLGQNALIIATLTAISNQVPFTISLYGTNRFMDFSQFTVRGHYESSPRLGRYFKATMWCAMADFQFTGITNDNSRRELAGTIAMHFLMRNSGRMANWKQIDDLINMFVGPSDALDFNQLGNLLDARGIFSPAQVPTLQALDDLKSDIMSGTLGTQNIQSSFFWSPFSPQQLKLPRSFAVLPSRFTMDAWALNQNVYDRIYWDSDGIPDPFDKQWRRVPSCLDVAFSVFTNNSVTPLIAERISNNAGHPWRDGYPYQHNLAAVRMVLDSQQPSGWTNCIYQSWLAALRELSTPSTAATFPDALRTRSWAMKTLNTQMASWTQLKHDTVLYAKQPYTGNVLCSYPEGFVEPVPAFWQAMEQMARRTRDLVSQLSKSGTFVFSPNPGGDPITNTFGAMWTNRVQHLDDFASNMVVLANISAKELARLPLDTNETYFLQAVIEMPQSYSGSAQYNGWYPKLYFKNTRGYYSGMFTAVDQWDPLVTDVHTDPTDVLAGDPGSILHQGVGNPALLVTAINWAPGDACVYAGPVFTHYEFETGPTTRKTDSEWKSQIKAGNAPPQPSWTDSYQVPGNISEYPPGWY